MDPIQGAIDQLAPEMTAGHYKSLPPWITTDIWLLKSKRDATRRRYRRTCSWQLLDEFPELAIMTEDWTKAAHYASNHDHTDEAIGSNKNFWQEMRQLGLIPKTIYAIHGFLPDRLNDHFAEISVSLLENPTEFLNKILTAPPEGFQFKSVSVNDVILVV